jgi:hypothetical protein
MAPLARSAWRLSAREWRVVWEACATAPFASLGVHVLSPARAVRFMRAAERPGVDTPMAPERIAAIVDAALTLLHARCLTKALVLQRMLARRGFTSEVVVGVASDAGALLAHAWLERDGRVMIGSGRREYAPLWRAGVNSAQPSLSTSPGGGTRA